MKLFKKKINTQQLADEEIQRCYEALKDEKPSSVVSERITGNIERIRKAEAMKYGTKTKLDPNKVVDTLVGTLIPTVIIVHAEKIKDVIITSKAFSKIRFK